MHSNFGRENEDHAHVVLSEVAYKTTLNFCYTCPEATEETRNEITVQLKLIF